MIADHRVDIPSFDDGRALCHLGDHSLTAVIEAPGIDLAVLVERKRVLLARTNGHDVVERFVVRVTLADILGVLGVGVSRAPADDGAPVGQGERVVESRADGLDTPKISDEIRLDGIQITPANDGLIRGDGKRVCVPSADIFEVAQIARRVELSLLVAPPGDNRAVRFEGDDMPVLGRDTLHAGLGGSRNGELAEVVFAPAGDAARFSEGDDPVRSDLNLFDAHAIHPIRDAGLTVAVESPGDEGAVLEDAHGERRADGNIFEGKGIW